MENPVCSGDLPEEGDLISSHMRINLKNNRQVGLLERSFAFTSPAG